MADPNDPVLRLHRHYIWAGEMREGFRSIVERSAAASKELSESEDFIRAQTYMLLWYGQLAVVVEGWVKLGLSDSDVDRLLALETGRQAHDGSGRLVPERFRDMLRRVRNEVFHFEPSDDYFGPDYQKFVADQRSVAWVQMLHRALGRYFLEWIGRAKQHTD